MVQKVGQNRFIPLHGPYDENTPYAAAYPVGSRVGTVNDDKHHGFDCVRSGWMFLNVLERPTDTSFR